MSPLVSKFGLERPPRPSISIAFNTGDGDANSRRITSGSVTIDSTTYTAQTSQDVLPADKVVSLTSLEGAIQVSGNTYGDANNNGKVDIGETDEINEDAKGLVIEDFDFGLALLNPTNPLDFAKYQALGASAKQIPRASRIRHPRARRPSDWPGKTRRRPRSAQG
jgi:hypothetical protein